MEILNSKQIKNIRSLLEKQFGIVEKLDFVFMINAKGKVYVITREVEKLDLKKLRIDSIGLYFGTLGDDGFRLSIEGSQIIGKFAKKNVLELDDCQFESWLKGEDFEVDTKMSGFVIVKYKKDFVGCGRIREKKLLNYVSKSRRLIVINN
ncbi:MAG: hypothetical protein KJ583_01560 [Nanoarchaeota archaeon]|nr:hypothetical protein [Nanoarchaeota archaeon]MBU1270001.1 hypothetical protein [Nanoarchaeota archaeon]MBU1603980.1 hypothetical protein [Nanoarchaeota archaeon]MBU2443687.1 hypothetical protein [Nanoarchaeota archaeon]